MTNSIDISLRFIGKSIVEMTIDDFGVSITSNVADLKGVVDPRLIENLRDVANRLEEHNESIK